MWQEKTAGKNREMEAIARDFEVMVTTKPDS